MAGIRVSKKVEAAVVLELRKRRQIADLELESKRTVWRDDPVIYAKERLGIDLAPSQKDILYSVRDNRKTAVKSHHAQGKSFASAVALLWWIDAFPVRIGYVTAPTWTQVLSLTFKEAKRLAIKNKLDFEILDSGWIRDKDAYRQTEHFIRALNAQTGEAFQGEHTAPILLVLDEAIGVPSYIYEAGGGLMTHPECRQLEIGNPTDESTNFGDNCAKSSYNTLTFKAFDHPNITKALLCEEPPIPKAISLLWLYEQLRDEAERVDGASEDVFEYYTLEVIKAALDGTPVTDESDKCLYKPTAYFQGRVLAEFPTEATSKVIPKAWLQWLPKMDLLARDIQIGCDVARFGDDRTTIFARAGAVCFDAKILRQFDHLAIAEEIKLMLERVPKLIPHEDEDIINLKEIPVALDVTGGLGTAPYDLLKSEGYKVFAVNSAEKANDAALYRNKRSELWFEVRDRAKEKNLDYSLLPMELRRTLEKELTAPEYAIMGGKKVVEDKKDVKKRLGASPDLADGFNLAYYSVRAPVIKVEQFRLR